MPGRIEYKYLAPNALLSRLRAEITPHVLPDLPPGDDAKSEYTVRSVYYDTPDFACFDEKMDGLKERDKFRIRGYGRDGSKSSVVFLEIKRKNESFIKKHRAPLAPEHLDALFATRDVDRYILGKNRDKEDAGRFLYNFSRYGLRPTSLVVYEREAFKGRFDESLRITFDKDVRGTPFPTLDELFDDSNLKGAMPGWFVFEVKFFRYALPSWVRSIIRRFEFPRLAISKYGMCMEAAQMDKGRWPFQRCHHAVPAS